MISSPQHDGDTPGPAGDAFPLDLELSLTGGDPVSGTIGILGEPPAVPFHGWIDLMSAINSLRGALPDTEGQMKIKGITA